MRHVIYLAALTLTLSGCLHPQKRPPPLATDAPAACFSKPQCDVMWSEAAVQLQSLTRKKLEIHNDTFMATFEKGGSGVMSGMARKVPMPDGSTAFFAKFTCYSCQELDLLALNLFIRDLKTAGERFGPTALDGRFINDQSMEDNRLSPDGQSIPMSR